MKGRSCICTYPGLWWSGTCFSCCILCQGVCSETVSDWLKRFTPKLHGITVESDAAFETTNLALRGVIETLFKTRGGVSSTKASAWFWKLCLALVNGRFKNCNFCFANWSKFWILTTESKRRLWFHLYYNEQLPEVRTFTPQLFTCRIQCVFRIRAPATISHCGTCEASLSLCVNPRDKASSAPCNFTSRSLTVGGATCSQSALTQIYIVNVYTDDDGHFLESDSSHLCCKSSNVIQSALFWQLEKKRNWHLLSSARSGGWFLAACKFSEHCIGLHLDIGQQVGTFLCCKFLTRLDWGHWTFYPAWRLQIVSLHNYTNSSLTDRAQLSLLTWCVDFMLQT